MVCLVEEGCLDFWYMSAHQESPGTATVPGAATQIHFSLLTPILLIKAPELRFRKSVPGVRAHPWQLGQGISSLTLVANRKCKGR